MEKQKEMKQRNQSSLDFIRGYYCALSTIIQLNGHADRDSIEVFNCNKLTKHEIRKYLDVTDQEIILEHWNQLNNIYVP